MKMTQRNEHDFTLRSPEITDTPTISRTGNFTVSRTVNGMPVSGDHFPQSCSIEDSDALRLLLTARRRANRETLSEISGGEPIVH